MADTQPLLEECGYTVTLLCYCAWSCSQQSCNWYTIQWQWQNGMQIFNTASRQDCFCCEKELIPSLSKIWAPALNQMGSWKAMPNWLERNSGNTHPRAPSMAHLHTIVHGDTHCMKKGLTNIAVSRCSGRELVYTPGMDKLNLPVPVAFHHAASVFYPQNASTCFNTLGVHKPGKSLRVCRQTSCVPPIVSSKLAIQVLRSVALSASAQ